jgi:phosphatidylserine decarboxylase
MQKKNNNQSQFSEKLLGWLFTVLPHHLISRAVFFLTRIKSRLATPVIRWFIKTYKVDMSDAEIQIIEEYECFNDFFIRSLTPNARPIASAENAIASPVDGTVSQCGEIMKGHLFQAKGQFYSVDDLLGGDTLMAHMFEGGKFATIYLAPYNYHRIHMPMDGLLKKMIHVPGRLFSVAPWTVRQISRLFARNERVVCLFSTTTGPMAMILVGAINVAAIETVWHGLVTPPKGKKISEFDYDHAERQFLKGKEMGRFNMGSTVILLTTDKVQWNNLHPQQTLRMGELIGYTTT